MTQYPGYIVPANCPPIEPVMSGHPPEIVHARTTARGSAFAVKLVITKLGQAGGALGPGGGCAGGAATAAALGGGTDDGNGISVGRGLGISAVKVGPLGVEDGSVSGVAVGARPHPTVSVMRAASASSLTTERSYRKKDTRLQAGQVPREGFEPPTLCLEGRCSIH